MCMCAQACEWVCLSQREREREREREIEMCFFLVVIRHIDVIRCKLLFAEHTISASLLMLYAFETL